MNQELPIGLQKLPQKNLLRNKIHPIIPLPKPYLMNLRICILLLLAVTSTKIVSSQTEKKPALVVGIVVDQMRFDYIYKYWERYGNDGFKKLVREGYQCKNLQYNYVPTYTGPGHSSIYTGTTPERHGIVSNDWFDLRNNKSVYCTDDSTVSTVGSSTVSVGKMSPRNLLSTTVGDELRVASNLKSRVFGIALKDRASILPAGHSANAAYWFDGTSGNWVSSTFYLNELPKWLSDYNTTQPAMKYLAKPWETLYDISSYTASLPDSTPYETPYKGTKSVKFPYNLPALMTLSGGQNLIRATPFGSTITKEFAIELIKQENLGKNQATDMLCVSFSSPDYIGHQFGTDAIETEDTYLRLDRDLAELLKFLDSWLGKEEVLIFLTADHGGATVPAYLMDLKVPGGYMDYDNVKTKSKAWLKAATGIDNALVKVTNDQIYLNESALAKAGKNLNEIEQMLADSLLKLEGIHATCAAYLIRRNEYTQGTRSLIQKGYFAKRSGHVMMTLEPNWMEYHKTGTTHGSPYSYDTRVPMLWYGWKVQHGESAEAYFIDDIAPTLSWMLNIPFPNATSGKPITIPLKAND
jgi:predicted AlkP superfamily pyrophosphatase or phosphodiesterase